jgi:hypothetical protein
MIDSGFETTALELLAQIARKTANLQPALPYTSISGTFYQKANDTVDVDILSNTSPYTLTITGDANGQVTFSTDGDADLRRALIFLSPPSFDSCIFKIENDNNIPISLIIESRNVVSNTLDRRGFGAIGVSPTSFELKFYPEL